MTITETETKIEIEHHSWTEQEAEDFVKEVKRLKELWPPEITNIEISITELLTNLNNDFSKSDLSVKRMNIERLEENEQRRQERIRKIEEQNKNLELPKSKPYERLNIHNPFDYWKNGCLYCEYKPITTHDYEVHIVTKHPGKPAYPGPADLVV